MGLRILHGERLSLHTQEDCPRIGGTQRIAYAIEMIADMVAEGGAPVTDREQAEMLDLDSEMSMDDGVEPPLALSPRRL
jgi:hypothetical protein